MSGRFKSPTSPAITVIMKLTTPASDTIQLDDFSYTQNLLADRVYAIAHLMHYSSQIVGYSCFDTCCFHRLLISQSKFAFIYLLVCISHLTTCAFALYLCKFPRFLKCYRSIDDDISLQWIIEFNFTLKLLLSNWKIVQKLLEGLYFDCLLSIYRFITIALAM